MPFRSRRKLDLHRHLDGSIRTRTILDLADSDGVRLPARTAKGLERHVTVGPRCRSLPDFLACFDVFLPVLKSEAAIERVARELVEDAAADGVAYVEARYAPLLQAPELTIEQSVEAALSGLRRGARVTGVEVGLILCGQRSSPPSTTLATAKVAVSHPGVVGLDIAGDERAPLAPHADAFRLAHRRGLPFTIHAGEAGPAANVREAIELGASRIGHGIRAVEDPRVLELAARRGITFEVCLTSNLQTRAVASIDRHPIARLRDAGVPVTLNTDDPAVSRITLSAEYAAAAKALGFGPADFDELEANARRAAFRR
jgi:adenosine deaminase